MSTLRGLVMAQVIVAALTAPSGAAPRTRHAAEAPRQAAAVDGGDGASLDVDAPEPAPPRRQVIAAAVEREAGWHAGITVGADFPVDALNVGFLIQAPSGLRLSSSVGFLTDVFLGLMDSSGDNHADSVMMRAALHDAVVWRAHLGMKPWKTRGFYASAGYTLCSLGGEITTGDALSALTDQMLPVGFGSNALMHMTSTLHALDLEAGWEWSIAHRFKFRTAISAAKIIASSTRIHAEEGSLSFLPLPPIDNLIAPMERAGEAAVDAHYKEAGPIVMFTVQLQVDLL